MSANITFPKFFNLPFLAREEVYKNLTIPDLIDLMLTTKKMNEIIRSVRFPAHELTVTVTERFTMIRFNKNSFGEFDLHYKEDQYSSNSTTTEQQINGYPVTAVKDVFHGHSSTKLFGDSHIAIARQLLALLRSFMPNIEIRLVIESILDPANVEDAMSLPFELCKSLEIREWPVDRDQFSNILGRISPGADLKIESRDGFSVEYFSPVIRLRSLELEGVMEWFSPEIFLEAEVRNLNVDASSVRFEHIREFLSRWKTGDFSSVKTIHLIIDCPFELEVPLPEYQAKICETKRKVYKQEDGEEVPCDGGYDVVRSDGTVATLLIQNYAGLTKFTFLVWDKEVTSNKRRHNEESATDKRRRV